LIVLFFCKKEQRPSKPWLFLNHNFKIFIFKWILIYIYFFSL